MYYNLLIIIINCIMQTIWSPVKYQPNIIEFQSPKSETSTCCLSESDHEERDRPFIFQNQTNNNQNRTEPASSPSNVKLKNELCKNYLRQGYCPYNNKCQFAHGPQELRQKTDQNNRYKTKKCNSFLNSGYCIYGQRCNFMHRIQSKNTQQKWKAIRKNYRMLLADVRQTSRLFPVTQQN